MAHWATDRAASTGVYDWRRARRDGPRDAPSAGSQPLFFLYGTPDWAAQRGRHSCAGAPARSSSRRARPETRGAFAGLRRAPRSSATAPAATSGRRRWSRSRAAEPAPPADEPVGGGTLGGVECPPLIPICEPAPPPPPPPSRSAAARRAAMRVRARRRRSAPGRSGTSRTRPSTSRPKVDVPALRRAAAGGGRRDQVGRPRRRDRSSAGMWGPRSAAKSVLPVKRVPEAALRRCTGIEEQLRLDRPPPVFVVGGEVARPDRSRAQAGQALRRPRGRHLDHRARLGRGRPAQEPLRQGARRAGATALAGAAARSSPRARVATVSRRCSGTRGATRTGGDAICDWCGNAGLRTKNGAAKPAWKAFARVARSLGSHRDSGAEAAAARSGHGPATKRGPRDETVAGSLCGIRTSSGRELRQRSDVNIRCP